MSDSSSGTFNTIQPHILVMKLLYDFNLDTNLVSWITDFIFNPQVSDFSVPPV